MHLKVILVHAILMSNIEADLKIDTGIESIAIKNKEYVPKQISRKYRVLGHVSG